MRIDIPIVNFTKKDILINPYLLGALLGDGSLSGNFAFSNNENDVIQKVNSILHQARKFGEEKYKLTPQAS